MQDFASDEAALVKAEPISARVPKAIANVLYTIETVEPDRIRHLIEIKTRK
jgi:hypothetical protein